MTEAEIRRRLRRHNAMQIGSAIVFVLGAIALWPLSFWVFRGLFYIPLAVFGWGDAGAISLYLTCMVGVMLLDQLGLIWTEVKEGEMLLRIPPGSG
jgi:hypothetical protein